MKLASISPKSIHKEKGEKFKILKKSLHQTDLIAIQDQMVKIIIVQNHVTGSLIFFTRKLLRAEAKKEI